MLHAVARNIRKVVRQECVRPVVVFGKSPENAFLFKDHGFVDQTGNPNNRDGGSSAHPDLPLSALDLAIVGEGRTSGDALRDAARNPSGGAAAGVGKDQRVIAYCGGGISATIDLFLLHQLGYDNLTLYDGSMGEWAKDASLPTGSRPTRKRPSSRAISVSSLPPLPEACSS